MLELHWIYEHELQIWFRQASAPTTDACYLALQAAQIGILGNDDSARYTRSNRCFEAHFVLYKYLQGLHKNVRTHSHRLVLHPIESVHWVIRGPQNANKNNFDCKKKKEKHTLASVGITIKPATNNCTKLLTITNTISSGHHTWRPLLTTNN